MGLITITNTSKPTAKEVVRATIRTRGTSQVSGTRKKYVTMDQIARYIRSTKRGTLNRAWFGRAVKESGSSIETSTSKTGIPVFRVS